MCCTDSEKRDLLWSRSQIYVKGEFACAISHVVNRKKFIEKVLSLENILHNFLYLVHFFITDLNVF